MNEPSTTANGHKGVDLDSLALDVEAQSKGTLFEFRGVKWIVASIESEAFQRAQRAAMRPYKEEARRSDLSPQDIAEIVAPAYARHILVGWEGLTQGGEPVPYSYETSLLICTDTRFREIYSAIAEFASTISNFRAERMREDAKN